MKESDEGKSYKKKKKGPDAGRALAKMMNDNRFKESAKFLRVDGSKLHCNLCGNSFSSKANVREDHCKSPRHLSLLKGRNGQSAVQVPITQVLAAKPEVAIVEKNRTAEHRVRVMDALLESGIAVHAVGPKLKELLEEEREYRLGLGSVSHLVETTIGPLQKARAANDLAVLKQSDGLVAFQFDGYSKKDEFCGIIMRTCTMGL